MSPARATRKRRSSGDNGDNGNSGEQPTANGSSIDTGDSNDGDEENAATPSHKRSARKGRGPMPYVSPGDEPLSPDLKASEL